MVEHALFCTLFDHIEQALPGLTTLAEIQSRAHMTASLLHGHGVTEQTLLYAALDHMLKEKDHFGRLFAEHHEMDGRMELVLRTTDLAEARRLLQEAMVLSREHFLYEEQTVFPLAEKHLQNESLEKLGALWKQRHTSNRR